MSDHRSHSRPFKHVPDTPTFTIRSKRAQKVHRDEHGGYNPLDRSDNCERLAVVLSVEEYVGNLGETTNAVEGSFSQLKRTIEGKNRFNRRQEPSLMLPDLLSQSPEQHAW